MTGTSRSLIILAGIFVFVGTLMLGAPTAENSNWQIHSVDTAGVARFCSLKIDAYGDVHVAYVVDDVNHSLKYSFWDHTLGRWFTMTVDQRAQFSSLALDSKQHPHISYVERGSMRGAKVRYAFWDGKSWNIRPIPVSSGGVAYYTSIALDAKDNPTISFYDHLNSEGDYVLHLRTVSWNGSYWESRTVDSASGSGKFNSIAFDSAGRLQIAYANVRAETSSLRYSRWNGRSWDFEVLEGALRAHPVYSVSMVLDKKDNPHIAYTDVKNRLVKYATRVGDKWEIQVVGSVGQVSYPDRDGIGLDGRGDPYISYYDPGAGVLKIAHQRDGEWVSEIVDRGFTGFTSTLQIGPGGLWVCYADEGAAGLKCAHKISEQAIAITEDKSHARETRK